MSNKLKIKTIQEITRIKKKFNIPSYQRGYRWTERQVEDLLNDINDFVPEENQQYCLQPIVVCQNNGVFNVIDGQQRLTTIFLILKHLEENNIEINYETRDINFEKLKVEEHIDDFYLKNAKEKIKDLFNDKIKNNFKHKFLANTFVIWYDVSEEVKVNPNKEIEIFTRLNSGKIPLTNAELVKALFLQKKNFTTNSTASQLQIAYEWDEIEFSLHNDAFWYFINKNGNSYDTRIDYLLEIISDKKNDSNDEYATFRYFYDEFPKENNSLLNSWQEIKNLYLTLQEWHQDHELHHKIGYLIACGKSLKTILECYKNSTKKEFKEKLDNAIKTTLKNIQLEEIQYGDGRIRKILLLHNIQTLLNGEDKTNFFPFEKYYQEKWDIEHIHATATDIVNNVKKEDRRKWLKNNLTDKGRTDNKNLFEDNIIHQNLDDKTFEEIIHKNKFEEDDFLKNLCLLDSATNRAYKNDSFKLKRSKLINQEKNGVFITVCTKNVFMKHYTNTPKSLELWNPVDRESYFDDIEKKLSPYLTTKENEQ
ncbi:DUF262 domain-containing protein [Mesonia mobilis]|uniref:DUF262 domain-containing protein n=1 Tax=Mesonia mobilis TaxID=369791 RepID=UPI0026EDC163|nr:DUF262 domain-containing protein [Mesonia mobilis]